MELQISGCDMGGAKQARGIVWLLFHIKSLFFRYKMVKKFKHGKRVCYTGYFSSQDLNEVVRVYKDWCKVQDESPAIRYAVCQLEKCKTTGRIHCQGYLHFTAAVRDTGVRKLWAGEGRKTNLHMEVAIDEAAKQENYCWKDDTCVDTNLRYSKGTPPAQGRRSDLEGLFRDAGAKAATAGGELWLWENHTPAMAKYYKAAARYMHLKAKQRRMAAGYVKPAVFIISGRTSIGKSTSVLEYAKSLYGVENIFYKDRTKWWHDYDSERCVIVEEGDGSMWSPHDCLRLFDGFPVSGENKGGHKQLFAEVIFVTTNTKLDNWWPEARAKKPDWDGWAAIKRKVTKEIYAEAITGSFWVPAAGSMPVQTDRFGSELIEISDDNPGEHRERVIAAPEVIQANQAGMTWAEIQEISDDSDDEIISDTDEEEEPYICGRPGCTGHPWELQHRLMGRGYCVRCGPGRMGCICGAMGHNEREQDKEFIEEIKKKIKKV